MYLIYRRKCDGSSVLIDRLYDRVSACYALAQYQFYYGRQFIYLKEVSNREVNW